MLAWLAKAKVPATTNAMQELLTLAKITSFQKKFLLEDLQKTGLSRIKHGLPMKMPALQLTTRRSWH